MILVALWSGERPTLRECLGIGTALAGLVYLVFPGVTAPTPFGSALMATAGIAWGVYTLRGRGEPSALAATTWNFIRTTPPAAVMALIVLSETTVTTRGVVLAVMSGAVASGSWLRRVVHSPPAADRHPRGARSAGGASVGGAGRGDLSG